MLLFKVRNAVQRVLHTTLLHIRYKWCTSTLYYERVCTQPLRRTCRSAAAQRYSSEVGRVSGDESEPRLVAVSARDYRLSHDLFVVDAANACIKWFDHRDGTRKQVYRAKRGARVHNALFPDARRLDLFAIDSLDNSGLNKAETRFRILRLRWTIKKRKMEDEGWRYGK